MARDFYEKHYHKECLIECEYCHGTFSRDDFTIHLCPEEMFDCVSDDRGSNFIKKDMEGSHLIQFRYDIEELDSYDSKIAFLVDTSKQINRRVEFIFKQVNQRFNDVEEQKASMAKSIEHLKQRVAEQEELISRLELLKKKLCRNCGNTFSDGDKSVCRYHPVCAIYCRIDLTILWKLMNLQLIVYILNIPRVNLEKQQNT
eukprot:TRINITY_DN446_c0_g1_i13.p2 TRINITY_DN446_c0_g1~~TRINITY_DN446_c0_g1_i13.p2  ORF type:complete len:201 (-),score=25.13 TRINITY_DN446_c0_g1_i13:399-1001(-)